MNKNRGREFYVTDLQGQQDLRDIERLHGRGEDDSTRFNVDCAASAKNPAR